MHGGVLFEFCLAAKAKVFCFFFLPHHRGRVQIPTESTFYVAVVSEIDSALVGNLMKRVVMVNIITMAVRI